MGFAWGESVSLKLHPVLIVGLKLDGPLVLVFSYSLH